MQSAHWHPSTKLLQDPLSVQLDGPMQNKSSRQSRHMQSSSLHCPLSLQSAGSNCIVVVVVEQGQASSAIPPTATVRHCSASVALIPSSPFVSQTQDSGVQV